MKKDIAQSKRTRAPIKVTVPSPSKNTFTFYYYDGDKQLALTAIHRSKAIEEARAKELLLELMAKEPKSSKYIYSVERNGQFINLLKKK